jgi:hypothetical protein
MNAVAFDTLKLAERLEQAGMPSPQARGVASAIAETMGGELVTKSYLDDRLAALTSTLDARISESKAEIVKWVLAMFIGQAALVVALIKLL